MNRLGSIAIRQPESVLEARKKIRLVTEAVTGDSLIATRLATVTSELARRMARENTSARIEVSIDDSQRGRVLSVDFVGQEHCPDAALLTSFFDDVETDGTNTVRGVLSLPGDLLLDDARLATLEAIVQQKGRDELMAEIQAKNLELQESLDNLRRTRSAKERMESELNIGRDIQMSMLPLSFPAFPDRREFDVHAALYPAREVGGDFYDLFLIDSDHFCFCVGDVSGKGVPAALFMAVTKTLIKSRAANDLSPASILSHVNTELSQRNESCMFVTVFLAILQTRTGEMVYANAGHNPPYVQRGAGGLVRLDQRHGPVIGAMEGIAYREDDTKLEPGDLVFLYTDGVTEAMNPASHLYSETRLQEVLTQNRCSVAKNAVDLGVEDVWRFQADADQADDITVMAVIYSGAAPEAALHELELRIENRLEEIDRVNATFNGFAERNELPAKLRRKLNLVFDELLNNIVSYAYDDESEHTIAIHIRLYDDRLTVMITDDGKPFNPFERQTPDVGLSVEDRPIGGLGVHLVRSVMDTATYERHGGNNVVRLEKRIDPDEQN